MFQINKKAEPAFTTKILDNLYEKSMNLQEGDWLSKVGKPEDLTNYLNGKYNIFDYYPHI
jgi:hypothetical protein